MEALLVLPGLAFLLVLFNSLSIRVVINKPAVVSEEVSILIPMRNEEKNVSACVETVINQVGLESFEILVLNDESVDQTKQELSKFTQIKALEGKELPNGWLGKLWALDQLVEESKGEYLVFLDADVRLTSNAVASGIKTMREWDFMSAYPKQIMGGFLQRIFQPLLQWSWMSSVPLLVSQKLSIKSMVVANGQFLIIKRDAYLKSGGHKLIKAEVLDDLMIAKQLVRSGFKGGVAEGSQVASCNMYESSMQLIKGYQKSLWKAFGSPIGALLVVIILFVSGVLPFILALLGSEIGLISYALIVASRILSAIRTNTIPNTAILHPVAVILLILLIAYSWIGKLSNSLTWRDRSVK